MEHPQQMSANELLSKMQMVKFSAVFKAAWELVKKNPLMLLLVFVLPLLADGILKQFVFPAINSAVLGGGAIVLLLLGLIFTLIGAAISFFGLGALVRATQQVDQGKAINLGEIFGYVRTHFVEGVKLAIRLFIYTGAWIPLLYVIVMGALTTIGLYSGRSGTALLGLAGLLGFLFIFVIIAYIVLFFKKLVNSSLAYVYFFTSDRPEVEGSLQSSLKISENMTWTIFWNYLLMGLVGCLIGFVLSLILTPIFVALGLARVSTEIQLSANSSLAIVSALVGTVVGVISLAFQYQLKAQLESFRGGKPAHEAPAHHAAPHHEAHHAAPGHEHGSHGDHTH